MKQQQFPETLDRDKAEEIANRALKITDDPNDHLVAAYSLQDRGLLEWAERECRHVMQIAPNGSYNNLRARLFLAEMLHDLEKATPGFIEHSAGVTLQKRVADPQEIVGPVLFLASDAASFVTAQTLSVCGGAT